MIHTHSVIRGGGGCFLKFDLQTKRNTSTYRQLLSHVAQQPSSSSILLPACTAPPHALPLCAMPCSRQHKRLQAMQPVPPPICCTFSAKELLPLLRCLPTLHPLVLASAALINASAVEVSAAPARPCVSLFDSPFSLEEAQRLIRGLKNLNDRIGQAPPLLVRSTRHDDSVQIYSSMRLKTCRPRSVTPLTPSHIVNPPPPPPPPPPSTGPCSPR
jgi:hypothetical protein